MRRIFIPLLLLALIPIHMPAAKTLPFDGQYGFYCESACEDEHCTAIKNGNGYIVSCNSSYAQEIAAKLDGISGEFVSFYGGKEEFFKAVRKLGRAHFYETEGCLVAEGFCGALKGGITKNGKTLNFQAAFADGKITVGTPLILGGF